MRLRTFALAAVTAIQVAAPQAAAAPRAPRKPRTPSTALPTWATPSAGRVTRSPAPAAPARSPASVAVETARAQLGKPYRWAASGPNAFDCSGLTMYAWAAAGVQLPHNSGAQYAALSGSRVSRDNLRPGDLVFSGYGRISHVGIYIGDGKMISAPQTGRNVEIAPLHRNFIGAARPAA